MSPNPSKKPSKIDQLWYHLKGISPPSPSHSPEAAAPPAISPQAILGGIAQGVERAGASTQGTLSNWIVSRQTSLTETRTRIDIADRSEDLIANDPHAASGVQAKAVNVAGTGFTPQSIPPETVLGITKDQARAFQEQAEWSWYDWTQEADAGNRYKFWMLQFMSTWDFIARGEFFNQPVMLDDPGRSFNFALQAIDTLRVYTPSDRLPDDNIRDGITLGERGNPLQYWVENPRTRNSWTGYRHSKDFAQIPAQVGHRPGMLHGFIPKHTEAVRGISALAPAMKFFKDLSDYLDFELVGAIIAASFPVFIEVNNPYAVTGHLTEIPGNGTGTGADAKKRYYQETTPGQVMYGNMNEKPHILESNRPGDTFAPFVERLLRAVGAAIGLPYEVIAKDFSKTNYSSARAALLEMWRELNLYQKWEIDSLCQPCWDMVIEEAWLRGRIKLPRSAPDFYTMRRAWCRAKWTPPKKGHVDPVKEMLALTSGYEAGFITLADVAAEMGTDWETLLRQRRREREAMDEMGLTPPEPAQQTGESNRTAMMNLYLNEENTPDETDA